MKTANWLIAIVWMAGISQARAEFVDGNELLRFLKEPDSSFDKRYATGYVSGVADAAQYARRRQGAAQGFCLSIPADVRASQLADAVRIWLEKYPQRRHFGGSGLVTASLEEFFPCK